MTDDEREMLRDRMHGTIAMLKRRTDSLACDLGNMSRQDPGTFPARVKDFAASAARLRTHLDALVADHAAWHGVVPALPFYRFVPERAARCYALHAPGCWLPKGHSGSHDVPETRDRGAPDAFVMPAPSWRRCSPGEWNEGRGCWLVQGHAGPCWGRQAEPAECGHENEAAGIVQAAYCARAIDHDGFHAGRDYEGYLATWDARVPAAGEERCGMSPSRGRDDPPCKFQKGHGGYHHSVTIVGRDGGTRINRWA